MIDRARLIGNWVLVKHGRVDALGNFHPTGERMNGQLIYASDGSMSVLITKVPEPVLVSEHDRLLGEFLRCRRQGPSSHQCLALSDTSEHD